MSGMLNSTAIKALKRIGNIMLPENGEFPSYSDYGGYEYANDLLKYAPADDIKDLNLVLSILSFMPNSILLWLVKKMNNSQLLSADKGGIFRQLDFGIKGILLSTYYSEKKGSQYKGKTPLEIIGYSVNRIY